MISTNSLDQLRDEWLNRLSRLIHDVKEWAEELGWSTRRIEVTLSDSQIGDYKAPAILLQEESHKVLVEPVARSAPGAEGIVDFYLMPAYDDIASLYFHENEWHVQYMFPGTSDVSVAHDREAKLLSMETFQEVLEALKENAVK
jgi:hypothetical protein